MNPPSGEGERNSLNNARAKKQYLRDFSPEFAPRNDVGVQNDKKICY